jgi:hypothetical protein
METTQTTPLSNVEIKFNDNSDLEVYLNKKLIDTIPNYGKISENDKNFKKTYNLQSPLTQLAMSYNNFFGDHLAFYISSGYQFCSTNIKNDHLVRINTIISKDLMNFTIATECFGSLYNEYIKENNGKNPHFPSLIPKKS